MVRRIVRTGPLSVLSRSQIQEPLTDSGHDGGGKPKRVKFHHTLGHARSGPCRTLTFDEIWMREKEMLFHQGQLWLGEHRVPDNYWKSKENRVKAVQIIVHKFRREG